MLDPVPTTKVAPESPDAVKVATAVHDDVTSGLLWSRVGIPGTKQLRYHMGSPSGRTSPCAGVGIIPARPSTRKLAAIVMITAFRVPSTIFSFLMNPRSAYKG